MRNFAKQGAMKRAVLGLVAFAFTSTEINELEQEFRKLDTEGSGVITLDDFFFF